MRRRRPVMPQGIETEFCVLPDTDDPHYRTNFDRATNAIMRVIYNTAEFMGPQIELSYNPDFMEDLDEIGGNVKFSQFLVNGSKAYNDLSAPEGCTPECPDPFQVVLYDQAMMSIMQQAAEEAAQKTTVKLMIPLMLFIFPAIFVVLIGPAVLNMIKTYQANPM